MEKTEQEIENYIFFDEKKLAHSNYVNGYICKIKKEQWKEYCTLEIGKDYDIIEGEFKDLRQTEKYIAEKLVAGKNNKLLENANKAKQAVENGYVTYKEAQFETNAQTVGDLTATMLMIQNERAEAESLAESKTETPFNASEVKNERAEAGSLAESKTDISYTWLSKDDKAVELTVEDFVTLGNLIAQYKNKVWNEKYLEYKTAIENAQTIEELNEIELDYGNFDI